MRPTFEDFKKEALADPEVAEEYERLADVYALRRELIATRLFLAGPLLSPALRAASLGEEGKISRFAGQTERQH